MLDTTFTDRSFERTSQTARRLMADGLYTYAMEEVQRFVANNPDHERGQELLAEVRRKADPVAQQLGMQAVPPHMEGAVRHLRAAHETLGIAEPPGASIVPAYA